MNNTNDTIIINIIIINNNDIIIIIIIILHTYIANTTQAQGPAMRPQPAARRGAA